MHEYFTSLELAAKSKHHFLKVAEVRGDLYHRNGIYSSLGRSPRKTGTQLDIHHLLFSACTNTYFPLALLKCLEEIISFVKILQPCMEKMKRPFFSLFAFLNKWDTFTGFTKWWLLQLCSKFYSHTCIHTYILWCTMFCNILVCKPLLHCNAKRFNSDVPCTKLYIIEQRKWPTWPKAHFATILDDVHYLSMTTSHNQSLV